MLERDGCRHGLDGMGCISSHTEEVMRHVRITLALVYELNSVYSALEKARKARARSASGRLEGYGKPTVVMLAH